MISTAIGFSIGYFFCLWLVNKPMYRRFTFAAQLAFNIIGAICATGIVGSLLFLVGAV